MSGTRNTRSRLLAPSTSSTKTSQLPISSSRIPIPPSRTAQTQSKLPVFVRSVQSGPQTSRGLPTRPATSTLAPKTPTAQIRYGVNARAPPSSRSNQTRGIYGPRTQVVNLGQGGTGAIPKTTVKTVKTKKTETSGNMTKTTTTVRKSYKPVSESVSSTSTLQPIPATSVAGPSKLPPGASVEEDVQQLDFAKDLVAPVSSLEQLVENELMEKLTFSPGAPARAKGSRKTATTPPIITTADGESVQGTLQINLDRSVERSPEIEYIKRYMTGIEVDSDGGAKKFEYSIQEAEPGSSVSRRSDRVVPLHEVISVKSTISFAPGVRQKVNTTVYESTEPDPVEVSQMIEEEAREIDRICQIPPPEVKGSPSNIYPIKKKLQKMQLNPESVRMLEKSVDLPPVSPDEAQEELAPEIMAAIMHTEEKGISMEAAPTNVYNYLFPKLQDDLLIKVKPVAPEPMHQVVVPEQIPAQLLVEGVPAEIEATAQDAKSCCCRQPTDNLYTSSMLKERPPKVYNTAKRGQPGRKGYPLLTEEQPPWSSTDLQPIMDLVGAGPKSAIGVDVEPNTTPMFYHNEEENVLEYHLTPQPPRFVSNVQLRGSQKPSWFPGYYMALPDNIRVVTSPCDVLPAAWHAVQPDIFAEDSFLIIG